MRSNHPQETDLALYAGGDLPLWPRLRVAWHLRRCARCRTEADALRRALAALREAGSEAAGFDWEALEAEMRANIRLGLAAGELVRQGRRTGVTRQAGWRTLAIVTAALAVVAVVSWTLHQPGQRTPATGTGAEIALHSTEEGLSVQWGRENAAVLGAGQAPVTAAVSWDGSVRAPFVDEETGQVTIYDVAAQ